MQRITYKQLSADALLPLYHLATIREEFIEKYNDPFDVPANRVFARDGTTWLKEEQYARQRFIQVWDENDQAKGLAVVKHYDAATHTYTLIATEYNPDPAELAEDIKTNIIDDDNAALDTTYSSEKIESLINEVSTGYFLLYNKLNERIIGNTEVLTFADTVIDPGDLRIGDVLYDTNAIVSRVVSIDRDAGTFTVKTMLAHDEGNSLTGLTYENDYNYSKNDYIIVENKLYKCTEAYTTSDTDTFAQDLADGKWSACNIYTTQNPDGGTVYYGKKAVLTASTFEYGPTDIIVEYDDLSDGIVKIKVGPREGKAQYNDLFYLTADVPDTGCLGSVRDDDPTTFPANPNIGNWVLIEECVNNAPGYAGIGVYKGGTWQILVIPKGSMDFPEPPDDDKLYLRQRNSGSTNGSWVVLDKDIDGNTNKIQIRRVDSALTPTLVLAEGELAYDSTRKVVLLGDGTKDISNLDPFYADKDSGGGSGSGTLDAAAIIAALGYTPQDASQLGQINGYAPLGADGKVPNGFLPDSSTDGYSKAEVDAKDIAVQAELITFINAEAATARAAEQALQDSIANHVNETSIHVTQADKDNWNGKIDATSLAPFNAHISDNSIHVTQAEKNKWNGMSRAYFVASVGALPLSGNEIGNLGYVRTSAAGVTPMTCDTYLWDGTSWVKYNADGGTGGGGIGGTAISFSWNDMTDGPNVTPLQIENAVLKMHEHLNKGYLDKIGQSATGSFMYDGVEIGVKIRFYDDESGMPSVGEADTLYLVYSDSRVRNFPSMSIWRDGSFQILGRGVQDTAQVIGDMVVLQSEHFGVAANKTVKIQVAENDQFAFMPLEILWLIPGLTSQEVIVSNFDAPENFDYNENLINVDPSSRLTARLAELPCELVTGAVGNYYHHYVDVDLSDYRDINYIG